MDPETPPNIQDDEATYPRDAVRAAYAKGRADERRDPRAPDPDDLATVLLAVVRPLPPDATDEQRYQRAVLCAHAAAHLVAQSDVPALLRDVARADAVGPLLDPTLWMEKRTALDEDRRALEAARPLWEFGRMMQARRGPTT